MPALGALLVALAEVFVGVFVKLLAIRFAFRLAVVGMLTAAATTAYFAITSILDGIVLPALPAGASTAWYAVNGDAIIVCASAIVGIETAIAFYIFARNNLKFVAGL